MRILLQVLILVIASMYVFSCDKGGNVNYKKELGATAKFHHKDHKHFIEEHGCIPCHNMNVEMSWKDLESAEKGSKKLIMPSKVTCHYCHNNPKSPAPNAPRNCYICHFNMKEIEPADHKTGNWLKTHKFAYEGEPKRCSECHRQKDCIDCHSQRDVIQHRVHPRNYEYTHGIEAAADPGKCSRCHQIGFCMECHTKGTWTK
ncbi:hypothetical protein Dester_0349 [Desulfurobacterium thermolithotrophum DSM 11699]|uniref:Uncharacterized protein n=1 Tax=Desulfurobacterium thermolithotrophum (strain DSM 11699 / BSA) TaxID=868864 RepID=F0S262_DESTD|nr:hypothetical protein [Desulfurobacterium thermolithotrophum]ADY73005.1 hypothetical protein Dester_0349 [Desulfurobacterium thermolithotrophum DSM 11699]